MGSLIVRGPNSAAALTLSPSGGLEIVFSQVANLPDFFTGLAILHPGEGAAEVTVEIFQPDGRLTGQAYFDLGPNERRPALLDELIPESTGQAGGWVRVRSTDPIVAQQIFGDFQGTFLATIPGTIVR